MATFFRFSSLPNEIISDIIETSDPEDIENLALCCKLVYNLAAKTLAQHKADKTCWSDLRFSVAWAYFSEKLLKGFNKLHDVATNRRLQRYPKQVTLHTQFTAGRHLNPREGLCIQDGIVQACDDIFKDFESPYIAKDEVNLWRKRLIEGAVPRYEINAAIANCLLLTLLPNVERLRTRLSQLGFRTTEVADMISTISRINQDAAPFMRNRLSLTKLRDVQIDTNSWVEEELYGKGVVEAFMTLPSLCILRLSLGPKYEFSKSLDPTPQSNVTEIHCIHSSLRATQVDHLLKRVKCLQIFSYDHSICDQPLNVEKEVSPGALLDVVLKHAATSLTYLNITADVRARRNNKIRKNKVGPVGSFRGFEAVKTMRLSRVLLFEDGEEGRDIEEEIPKKLIDELPASLEELELVERITPEEAQLMFAGMLEMKHERLPKLRYVAFEGCVPFDEETVSVYKHAGLVLDWTAEDHVDPRSGMRHNRLRLGGIECIREELGF